MHTGACLLPKCPIEAYNVPSCCRKWCYLNACNYNCCLVCHQTFPCFSTKCPLKTRYILVLICFLIATTLHVFLQEWMTLHGAPRTTGDQLAKWYSTFRYSSNRNENAKPAYYSTPREMFRAEPANADSTQHTWPQGLYSNAQWYQSHPWKLLYKFVEFRLWTVVQLLSTLKDSSNYGHKIHLHRSTCGLFLHYRWIDWFQKQITYSVCRMEIIVSTTVSHTPLSCETEDQICPRN